MNYSIPISSKGQFVIPSAVRKILGIQTGTRLRVTLSKQKIIMEPEPTSNVEDFYGSIHESSNISTKQIILKGKKRVMKRKFFQEKGV